ERVAELLDVGILTVSLLDPEREQVLTVAEYARAEGGARVRFDDPTERPIAAVPALDRVLADIEPVYMEHGDALRLGKGVGGWGLGVGPDSSNPQPPTPNPQPPTRGWAILLPMASRGQVHGVLYVADTRPERVFSGLEIAICSTIAAQAATA